MSAKFLNVGRLLRVKALLKPVPVAALLIFASLVAFTLKFEVVSGITPYLDARSDKIYSSAFTFLVAFWGACLTVWGLLKSRATRYVERLSDNIVFKAFMRQYERRLLYAFLVIVGTFIIYVMDLKLAERTDWSFYVIATWIYLFLVSSIALGDVLLTARELLD